MLDTRYWMLDTVLVSISLLSSIKKPVSRIILNIQGTPISTTKKDHVITSCYFVVFFNLLFYVLQ